MALKLDDAQAIVAAAVKYARANNLKPMGFVVLDERGALRTAASRTGRALRAGRSPTARPTAR
jgi:uncharacterized protein GlcG (DUF336 family)